MRKDECIGTLCAGISNHAGREAFREELRDHMETKTAIGGIHRTPEQVLNYVFLGLA